jgi:hypothetical protein
MDLLFWLLLGVMATEVAGVTALLGVSYARTGRPLDLVRPRVAVVEVEHPLEEARALCREGRRLVRASLRFTLHPLGGGRTRVAVSSLPGFSRARREQLDRFAAWLAERGGGRVVEVRFGTAS